MGQKGLSHNVYVSVADVLQKHEFVKVKMGGGCSDNVDEVAASIARNCECECVHTVGFVLLFYRNLDLPRPAHLNGAQGDEAVVIPETTTTTGTSSSGMVDKDGFGRRDGETKSAMKNRKNQLEQQRVNQKKPSAFTVL